MGHKIILSLKFIQWEKLSPAWKKRCASLMTSLRVPMLHYHRHSLISEVRQPCPRATSHLHPRALPAGAPRLAGDQSPWAQLEKAWSPLSPGRGRCSPGLGGPDRVAGKPVTLSSSSRPPSSSLLAPLSPFSPRGQGT